MALATPTSLASAHALDLLRSLHCQLKNLVFCDVVITVCSQEFSAHKTVLAAASPYFHAMFTAGLAESTQNKVQINGTTSDIFEILLNFIYTGDIEITEENCQNLLSASDLFGILHVQQECCHFLQQHVDPSNCIGIYNLADAHSCADLKRYTEKFVCRHFLDLCMGDEFLSLNKEGIFAVLNNEHLGIEREMQVFDAAMRWINHNISERRNAAFAVLDAVRIPLIAKQILDLNINCHDRGLMFSIRDFAKVFYESPLNRSSKLDELRKAKPHLFREREGIRRTIMIVGGYSEDEGQTLSSAELFDTFHESWKQVPALQYGRSAHGTAVLNGLVYVLGGEENSMIYDNVECYDQVTGKWMTAPSMIVPRCDLGAAVVDGYIYAIGGWIGSEIGVTMERFCPLNNEWEQIGKMQTPRTSMGVVAYEGLLYILGGLGAMNEEEESCVESYDPVTRRWCKLASMLTPRACLAVCAGDDFIYAIGGYYTSGSDKDVLASVEKYDIHMDKWTFLTDLKTPRASAAVAYHNNMLYIFGGRTKTGFIGKIFRTLDAVECYDLQAKSWSTVGAMNIGRCDAGIAVL